VAQVGIAQGAIVHMLTRSAQARKLALELGAVSAGAADADPGRTVGRRGVVRPGR
jgi:propanol-preferring alcohol dehydrogenase